MVFNPKGERGQGTEYVLANPRIMTASKQRVSDEESCLSFIGDKRRHRVFGDVEVRNSAQICDGTARPARSLTFQVASSM